MVTHSLPASSCVCAYVCACSIYVHVVHKNERPVHFWTVMCVEVFLPIVKTDKTKYAVNKTGEESTSEIRVCVHNHFEEAS